MYPYMNNKPIFATETPVLEPEESTSRFALLIEEAVAEENLSILQYDALAKAANNKECADIYTSMANDDRYHIKLLQEVYKELTGIKMPIRDAENAPENKTSHVLNEIETAKFYRDLAFSTENNQFTNTFNLIMNDKQNHALLNMYILNFCDTNK